VIRNARIQAVPSDAIDALKGLKTAPSEDGGIVWGREERVVVVIKVGS
jgi:hypothetical protein